MTAVSKPVLGPALVLCVGLLACREAGPRCQGEWCGTAAIVTAADASALLPPLPQTNVDLAISDLIFLRLADIGPSMNTIGDAGFVPRLARSWRFETPVTLAFDIDPRAKWQDGVPVTAPDVAFTFDVYRDTLVNSPARPLLDRIASVSARNERTAVFRFRRSYPEQFYDATSHMRILPRHRLDTIARSRLAAHPFVRNPVGDGPYRLVRWNAGQAIDLAADSTFFLGRPGLARITWRVTPDFATAVTQLVAGEADIMEFLGGPENVARVKAAPQLRVVEYPSPGLVYVSFNLRDPDHLSRPHPLFADRELRRALFMGTNRAALVQALLAAYGSVPAGPISGVIAIGNDATVEQLPFDSARARRALASLGWRDTDGDGVLDQGRRRLGFELLVPTSSQLRRRAAVILQDQMKRLGVAVTITELEFNLFVNRTSTRRFHAALIGMNQDPTPSTIQQIFTTASIGQLNYGSYSNHRVDQLVDAAANEGDPERAREKWREVLGGINADAPGIWLYTPVQGTAVHRRYENVSIRPDQWAANLWTWRVPPDRLLERDRVGAATAPAH